MPINVGDLEATLGIRTGEFDKGLSKAQKKMQATARVATQVGGSMTKGLTAPILAVGVLSAKAAIEFESSFTGIRKTVSGTELQFEELAAGMRGMAKEIPVSVNELNKIGESAGQLGIKTENILDFTETMAQLGVTTNLTSDQAATAFARIANIMGTSQTEFDRMGSAVVTLGNNMATTESEIVDMSLGIAAAGRIAGLSESDVFAFSATLSSIGINAAAGATSISKTFMEIQQAVSDGGDKLDVFAKVSGKTSDEFAAAWGDDPTEAIISFIEGLGNMEAAGEDMGVVFTALEIQEIRQQKALKGLAVSQGLLRKATELSNLGWKENNALAREAALRFGDTKAKLKVLGNQVNDVGIELGNTLIPVIVDTIDSMEPLIDTVGDMVKWFGELDPTYRNSAIALAGIVAAAGPVLWIAGSLTSAWITLAGAFGIGTIAAGVNTKATGTNSGALGTNIIAAKGAEISQKTLGVTTMLTAGSYHTLTAAVNGTTTAYATNAGAGAAAGRGAAGLGMTLGRVVWPVAAATALGIGINELSKVIINANPEMQKIADNFDEMGLTSEQAADKLDDAAEPLTTWTDRLGVLNPNIKRYTDTLVGNVKANVESKRSHLENAEAAQELVEEVRELDAAFAKERDIIDKAAESLANLSGLTNDYFEPADQAEAVTRDLDKANRDLAVSNDTLSEATVEWQKHLDNGTTKTEDGVEAYRNLKDAEDGVFDATTRVTELEGDITSMLKDTATAAGLTAAEYATLTRTNEGYNDLPLEEKLAIIDKAQAAKNVAEQQAAEAVYNSIPLVKKFAKLDNTQAVAAARRVIGLLNQINGMTITGRILKSKIPSGKGGPLRDDDDDGNGHVGAVVPGHGEKTFKVMGGERILTAKQNAALGLGQGIRPNTNNMGGVTININGAGGNAQSIAQEVERVVTNITRSGKLKGRAR